MLNDPFGKNAWFDFKKGEPTFTGTEPKAKTLIISLILTALIAALYFYISLPALNPRTQEFWTFVMIVFAVFTGIYLFRRGLKARTAGEFLQGCRKDCIVPAAVILACVVIMFAGGVIGHPLLHAGAYSRLLPFETGDFSSDVEESDFSRIPMLDSASSNTLATRKLGELRDLVSQFEVDPDSAQINYRGKPVRVSYLNYGDIIKWWNNRASGIPAYIITDMQSQAVSVVRLESGNGIKYSPSEHFNRYLYRHLRFSYPTAIFGEVNFEIDEEGKPYWIASVEKKTIGLFDGTDIRGAVLVNAVTGETEYYDIESVPQWVDRVYSSNLVMTQYNYYGLYHNGFINSIFGQQDCTIVTQGYNYLAMNDDVWLYTGVTSVGGDESNVGFILVNQRTKEAKYYSCAGAEEYSGMASAEGAVQQYSYAATFPLLLNISGQPTYFMALKDNSQLVKMYAMVNVREYQLVATAATVSQCQENYVNLLAQQGIIGNAEAAAAIHADLGTVEGKVVDLRSAVIDGNTVYYIKLDEDNRYFTISAADAPMAVILDVGDRVEISCAANDNNAIAAAASLTVLGSGG